VQFQQQRPAGGDAADAELQLAEPALHMPHQRLALGRQAYRSALALEQHGAKVGLQPADRVADGAWRQAQIVGGGAERAGAGRGFERTQRGERQMQRHGRMMKLVHG
jgi:hypothetical protein